MNESELIMWRNQGVRRKIKLTEVYQARAHRMGRNIFFLRWELILVRIKIDYIEVTLVQPTPIANPIGRPSTRPFCGLSLTVMIYSHAISNNENHWYSHLKCAVSQPWTATETCDDPDLVAPVSKYRSNGSSEWGFLFAYKWTFPPVSLRIVTLTKASI